MHTFFINTSGKELENYKEILEMQLETRNLVSLNCPMSTWQSEDGGYQSCARKMGELIDSYKEINNNFNLILYVDLIAYDAYTCIPMNRHRERYACLQALYTLFTHYIKSTLVEALRECGREPQAAIIIFEENRRPEDGQHDNTEDGKNLLRTQVAQLLGLPGTDVLNDVVKAHFAACEAGDPKGFAQQLQSVLGKELIQGLYASYPDQIDTFLKEAKSYEVMDRPLQMFLDRVIDRYAQDENTVKAVSFVTNRKAGIANKQECARRDLRLYLYLLDCVYKQAVCVSGKTPDGYDIYCARPFPQMDEAKWETVVAALKAKSKLYQKKYKEAISLSDSYSSINLAPELYAFDHERFGMDAYGTKGSDLVIVDEEQEPQDSGKNKKEKNQPQPEGTAIVAGSKKAMVETEKKARGLFSKSEYAPFNYNADEEMDVELLRPNASAEQYIEKAKKLRTHHLNYLKKLKVHVTDVLSNYAGRSLENDPALLQKRKVSIAQEDFEDLGRDYKYAKAGRPPETQKLKTVKDISQVAYETAQTEYLKFCAGRSVAVTDIEEHCNRFITRICQIAESLKKLKLVAIGLLAAILVLYIPFVVVQWEAITRNLTTLVTALASIGIPIVILYMVFTALSLAQRRKFAKEWEKFKDDSDKVLQENSIAAEKYDQLLSIFVPSLRWVYEYKIDVEFYMDCCKMARAKVGHHIQKLHDRVVTIGNILEDMECEGETEATAVPAYDAIDYNVAFCAGKGNRAFYSIIDNNLLDAIQK